MTLNVETFAGGPIDTNAYLVFDDASKQILIIDAPMDVDEPLKKRVDELGGEVVLVVLTHAHWDHIGTTNLLHNEFSAPVAAHPLTKISVWPNREAPSWSYPWRFRLCSRIAGCTRVTESRWARTNSS